MSRTGCCETLWEVIEREGEYSNAQRLRFHMEGVFDQVGLEGKRVLDIGAGKGLHGFYAAAMGAAQVLCLEPEAAGSQAGRMIAAFHKLQSALPFGHQVRLLPVTFQQFGPETAAYDVILLHDSINHLDENACIRLQCDAAAQESYRVLFRKMAQLMTRNGTLIVADCSRYNFFPLLGFRNPLAPQVEWEKHQSPAVWTALLAAVGFGHPRVCWTSPNRLGKVGRIALGNRFAGYFLLSHFRMTMELVHAGRENLAWGE